MGKYHSWIHTFRIGLFPIIVNTFLSFVGVGLFTAYTNERGGSG